MKKKFIIIITVIILIFLVIGIYFIINKNMSDEVKFKKEYESLNGQKTDTGTKHLEISIPKDNNIEYLNFEEVMDFLDNGTGILYFGFPECPWCRNAVPVLVEAAKENEIENIYYYNALSIRDIKELNEEGEIVTTKEGTKEYYKLIDKLEEHLNPYDGLNDESIKRLYFPTVFFVMGGKIVGMHESTIESQENPYKELTEEQKQELKDIYMQNINAIYGTCDESC